MNCPKCHLPVEDDTFFCEHCGAPLDNNSTSESINTTEDMEKTMAIPTVKPGMVSSPEPEHSSVVKPVVKKSTSQKNTSKKDEKAKALKLKLKLTTISFVVTLIIGLGVCALVIFTDDSPKSQTTTFSTTGTNTEQNENGNKQKKPEHIRIVEGSSEGEKEAKTIPIDTDFDFDLNCTLASLELSYKSHSDTEFGYSCEVPNSFEKVYENDTEVRYRAADNTAYVDVGAFENTDELTRGEIKSAIKEELNGEILREETGDDWFIMVTKADNVVYYIKCFVGDYVKYMEFVNPAKYSEVYNVFISDMEPLFKSFE